MPPGAQTWKCPLACGSHRTSMPAKYIDARCPNEECLACYRCKQRECTERCKKERKDAYENARNYFAGDPSKPLGERPDGMLRQLQRHHLLTALRRTYPMMVWEDVELIIARPDVTEGTRVQLQF